jgi:hypothetical protein
MSYTASVALAPLGRLKSTVSGPITGLDGRSAKLTPPGTGVEAPVAGGLELRAAAPNPFQTSTRMDFSTARRGPAELSVYDVTGRHVATLFDGVAEAGPHAATWDGRFADGREAPSGVYRCRLRTDEGVQTRSIVLSR